MIRSCFGSFRAGALAGIFLAGSYAASAADVSTFYARKGLVLEQTSAAAPTANPFAPALFIARATGNLDALSDVTLSSQSTFFPVFPIEKLDDRFESSIPGSTQDLDGYFPSGNFTFTFNGSTVAPLTFSAGSFPTPTPQVLNYDAAQTIDASANFNLMFSPYTGAGAGDSYEFEILNGDGTILFQKSGTGSSVTIPAGTLETDTTYDARLRFVHNVASNTTSIPGATGTAGYFKENQFTLSTGTDGGGGGGGGDDTTPPSLVFTTPSNGATGVPVSSTVAFVFSESMAPQQSILWSGNVNAANFSYSWGQNNQFLTASYAGGFPANATITWSLVGGATGFKDVAGNPLTAGASGSFTTAGGGGGNPDCTSTNEAPSGWGGGILFKSLNFVQTGNTAPTADPENPASAFGSYSAATNQNVTAVNVTGPNNINLTLSNLFGNYIVLQDFPSGAAMDAFLPSGIYTITATGAGSGMVTVPAASAVPVPRFNNLEALRTFDPTKDFTLQFAPYTGAGPADGIAINITAPNGDHFYAPDYCLNRLLPNTATSVVIPANTFKAGDVLSGDITFSRFSSNTNAIPNTYLSAGATVTTKFDFSGGNPGSDIQWISGTLSPAGTLTYSIQAPAGSTLVIEASTDLKAWTQVSTLPVTSGTASFDINTKAAKYQYFRARLQ